MNRRPDMSGPYYKDGVPYGTPSLVVFVCILVVPCPPRLVCHRHIVGVQVVGRQQVGGAVGALHPNLEGQ